MRHAIALAAAANAWTAAFSQLMAVDDAAPSAAIPAGFRIVSQARIAP